MACFVYAACLEVMATLMVVGVMDDARGDIKGNNGLQLNFAERLSQVCPAPAALCISLHQHQHTQPSCRIM